MHEPPASSGPGKIGVLLVNLGTPSGPDTKSVRRYLAEFLSDRRVVEIPPIVWQPILRGLILPTRPRKSARAYAQVWGAEGSPLAAITRAQVDALAGAFGPNVVVDHAMRYGGPSIDARITALSADGCERILIAPLYPQYCAATTATANDVAYATMARMRVQPALRVLPPYYGDALYIDALKRAIDEDLAALDFVPDTLLASFHGMPQRTADLGDPYHRHCLDTVHRLEHAMGRPIAVSFQSRFGRAKWLEPATETTLAALPKKGVGSIAVVAPGFAADCVETLEELMVRGRETFMAAGGKNFAYLPCLNARPMGTEMLRKLLLRELEGWLASA